MTQEILKLALEYIEAVPDDRYNAEHIDRDALITAIEEALAQPEQWGASAVTHPEYVAEQKRKTEELRSMLTQPEQEPVAWMDVDGKTFPFVWNVSSLGVQQGSKYLDETLTPLYTHPQPKQEPVVCCQQYDTCLQPCTPRGEHLARRTWTGLTDEERSELVTLHHGWNEYGQAIEAKLKEKNT